ncbi:MAG: hypothetical protein ACYC1C_19935 [Chloroflexota bacterium]
MTSALWELLSTQLATPGLPFDDYLVAHSHLPGPAANLSLLYAAAEVLQGSLREGRAEVWDLLGCWSRLSLAEAPVNDPREFLPALAALAHGTIGAAIEGYWDPALVRLQGQARDSRWRTREMVGHGLLAMALQDGPRMGRELGIWVEQGDLLEMRAVAAAVADPRFVADRGNAEIALALHEGIMARLRELPPAARRTEEFRALRKGLGYTLSVVAVGIPGPTFALLGEWCRLADRDVRWIVKENLKKDRLRRASPEETARLRGLVAGEPG